jgi:hypothetical protein
LPREIGPLCFGGEEMAGAAMATAGNEVFALTDEQIVGLESEDTTAERGEKEKSNAETLSGAEGRGELRGRARAGRTHALRDSEQEGIVAVEEAPKWLAERMRDPWHGDEAKELWDGKQRAERENASYREAVGSAEDARALKEIYPGGVTEAKIAAERARELDAIDAAFYRGDGAARMQLAQRMMQQDPVAFREMVEAGVRLLKETAGAARDQRTANGDQGTAGENRKSKIENGGEERPPMRGLEEAGARVPQEVARAYGEFEQAANAELEKSVGGAIARVMEEALPNLRVRGARGKEGELGAAPLRERLTVAVREEVESALKSDRALGEQVTRILAGRRFDSGARGQVVRLIDARAQELVPGAVRRVVGSWTQATLGARGKSVAEKIETRREPVSRHRRVDYIRMSDDDILGL